MRVTGCWSGPLRAVCVASAIALASSIALADSGAPMPAPVPWTWTVQWDMVAPQGDLVGFSAKLGGRLTGLRNTRFDVGGGRTVQINALVAESRAAADAIFASVTRTKPSEFVVRRGNVVFEFVGKNEVLPQIQQAASMLRSSSSDN